MAWSQKTIWSDTIIRRPIGGGKKLVRGYGGKKKNKRSVFVYLFRISTKGSDEEFLKIGITNSISERFETDYVRYKFRLIGGVGGLSRPEALKIESLLHDLFKDRSYRPKNGFVSGGHTECFFSDDDIVSTTLKVFELTEDQKELEGRKRTSIKPFKANDPHQDNSGYNEAQEARDEAERDRRANGALIAEANYKSRVEFRLSKRRKEKLLIRSRPSPSVELLKNQSL